MSIDRETRKVDVDQLDIKIRQEILADRRRAESRRIISEAVVAHRRALSVGRPLLAANTILLESIGYEALIRERTAALDPDSDQVSREGEGLFKRALHAVVDSFLGSVIEPAVSRILESLGVQVGTRAHSVLQRVISNSFEEITNEILSGRRAVSDLWNCDVLAKSFAEGTAESLPEALFDTLVGSGKDATGMIRTLREAIANYFKDDEIVQEIADGFKEVICKTDFVDLMRGGASKIQSAALSL